MHERCLDEVLQRKPCSRQHSVIFGIEHECWVVHSPFLNVLKSEVCVTAKFLQRVQSVVLDHDRDFEVCLHGQLVRLLHEVALPLVNIVLVALIL